MGLIMALTGLLVLLASALPLLAVVGKPWPGYFYSPFYTTNVFTNQTTPAWKVGLRPEDRVIRVGSSGIDQFQVETARVGVGGKLYLIYELGRVLTAIEVRVEELDGWRLLEKSAPLFLAGIMLVGLGAWRLWNKNKWAGIFSWLVGLGLLAAPDYFLGPGHGLESGFDPANSLGKWSSYFYFPIWTIALATGWVWATQRIFAGNKRLRGWAFGVGGLLLAFDLLDYLYAVWRTATYNNPDYVVWHSRGEFWVGWLGLALLFSLVIFLKKTRMTQNSGYSTHSTLTLTLSLLGRGNLNPSPFLAREGGIFVGAVREPSVRSRVRFAFLTETFLLLFIGGYVVPTIFDFVIPGPGPQWYCLGLVCFLIQNQE